MPRSTRPLLVLTSILAGAALIAGIDSAFAFSDGPPDGVAGDPPAGLTCTSCHSDFPLNSGDGTLSLIGAPTTIVSGQPYQLMVELDDPGQSRWGFELTVLNAANEASGTLVVTDSDSTQLSDNPDPEPDYLKHTDEGTRAGTPGPRQWSFEWIGGDDAAVVFYVAGNAANNDDTFFGDFIYSIQATAGSATAIAAVEPAGPASVRLHPNVPNPFNPSTSIRFDLTSESDVRLRIVDVSGRTVRTLAQRRFASGRHAVTWNGLDDRGAAVSSGVYFYRLAVDQTILSRKMLLVE